MAEQLTQLVSNRFSKNKQMVLIVAQHQAPNITIAMMIGGINDCFPQIYYV